LYNFSGEKANRGRRRPGKGAAAVKNRRRGRPGGRNPAPPPQAARSEL